MSLIPYVYYSHSDVPKMAYFYCKSRNGDKLWFHNKIVGKIEMEAKHAQVRQYQMNVICRLNFRKKIAELSYEILEIAKQNKLDQKHTYYCTLA